jgi:hypothetical protein
VLSLGILFCSTHARGLLASNYLNLIAVGWGYNTLDVIFSAIICHMVQPKFQIANEANSHVVNGHPTLGFPRYGIGLGIPEPPRAGGSRAWNSASRKINSSGIPHVAEEIPCRDAKLAGESKVYGTA